MSLQKLTSNLHATTAANSTVHIGRVITGIDNSVEIKTVFACLAISNSIGALPEVGAVSRVSIVTVGTRRTVEA